MKIYALHLSVRLTTISDFEPEEPPAEQGIADNLPDDPVKASGVILDRYFKKATQPAMPGMFAGEPDAMMFNQTFKIVAGTFEELQTILAKFHATAEGCTLEGVAKR